MELPENITRKVRLWIDNERQWHEMVKRWARKYLEDTPRSLVDDSTKAKYCLADRMETFFVDFMTDLDNHTMTDDVVRTALVYVDWDDIAESYISQVENEM